MDIENMDVGELKRLRDMLDEKGVPYEWEEGNGLPGMKVPSREAFREQSGFTVNPDEDGTLMVFGPGLKEPAAAKDAEWAYMLLQEGGCA